MKKTGKNKRTHKVQPSEGRLPSTPSTLPDLTDADLEKVQGGFRAIRSTPRAFPS